MRNIPEIEEKPPGWKGYGERGTGLGRCKGRKANSRKEKEETLYKSWLLVEENKGGKRARFFLLHETRHAFWKFPPCPIFIWFRSSQNTLVVLGFSPIWDYCSDGHADLMIDVSKRLPTLLDRVRVSKGLTATYDKNYMFGNFYK